MEANSLPGVNPALKRRRTASDYVAEALRAAIVDGTFLNGQDLNQVELAAHFGVSRVPVREALRRLEAEGLIRADAHRRAVVIALSRERIVEVFELRMLIEGGLLRRAAPAHDQRSLSALETLCDDMDRTDDHETWIELNHRFHRDLHEPADWKAAQEFVDHLRMRVARYTRVSGGLHRNEDAGGDHRAILAALRSGDCAEAQRRLHAHIAATLTAVQDWLDRQQASGPRAVTPTP